MFASSWFLTLFTTQLPLTFVSHTMDLFLSEVRSSIAYVIVCILINILKGMEMIFRLSIALLEIHQDELMLLSMEDMLKVTF